MDAFRIVGGAPLRGQVEISGSKNAALPCLFASLLTSEPVALKRVPRLRDTRTAMELLASLGKNCVREGNEIVIEEAQLAPGVAREAVAPYELVKQMRASVWSTGPMLARWGRARVSLPGGCAIGVRPIDIHLDGFKAMGAKIQIQDGDVILTAPKDGLRPARHRLRYPSVGATVNLMLAASLIDGKSILEGVAREPEIVNLADLLNKMGALIKGAGSKKIVIEGVKNLRGADHEVIADRIETGTFVILAGCVPGSTIKINHCQPEHNQALLGACAKAGLKINQGTNFIHVQSPKGFRSKSAAVSTDVYPAFPTDLQPLWMAMMARGLGRAVVRETVFENRFLHAAEMSRMGCLISVRGDKAMINGVDELAGAKVMASDLRAGAALVAMALAARGESVISRIYHIDRGYERFDEKLRSLGAQIQRFEEVRYQIVKPESESKN